MTDLKLLVETDPDLVELPVGDGGILVSPGLQGRIFCHLGGEVVHRVDQDALRNPDPDAFNNSGGNSLWPAPEGGPLAFNYPPDDGDWYVQKGVGSQPAEIVEGRADTVVVGKNIHLVNRRGTAVDLRFERRVSKAELSPYTSGFELSAVGYLSEDSLVPLSDYRAEGLLLGAWSLEQFPAGRGITAFGRVEQPEAAINLDFYPADNPQLSYYDGYFTLRVNSADRLQIGIDRRFNPEFIGVVDAGRSRVILRWTAIQEDGRYFNIADNEQESGPFSAEDAYSVFDGSSLGFYELETIAPMLVSDGLVNGSINLTQTVVLEGELDELLFFLEDQLDIVFDQEIDV